jgi:uncharacterized protein (DUF488 family)
VRRYPASKRHPHFARERLVPALAVAGIEYLHAPELGGRRAPLPDSPNGAWRSASFRAYADHMASPEFDPWLRRLLSCAEDDDTVIMCAEAVPWRCHRQLIADALVARGVEVRHIIGPDTAGPHRLNEAAVVADDLSVTYPGSAATRSQPDLFPG